MHQKRYVSEETRQKIRLTRLGKKDSLETRLRKSLSHKSKILGPQSEEQRKKTGDRHRGSKCNFWQGGISFGPYSADYNSNLKEEIRKRDNYTCQICGITEEENIIVFGKVLSTHHVDYNKLNSSPSNLVAVCVACHTRTNHNRAHWIEYFKNKLSTYTLGERKTNSRQPQLTQPKGDRDE